MPLAEPGLLWPGTRVGQTVGFCVGDCGLVCGIGGAGSGRPLLA